MSVLANLWVDAHANSFVQFRATARNFHPYKVIPARATIDSAREVAYD